MHINCLELLAVTLAVMTFLKNKTRMSVLLRLDNTTAVAYINNLGGIVYKELVDLAKSPWMWCLERNIHIITQHLSGVQNVIADVESRTMIDQSDWQLNPVIFSKVLCIFGPIEVDMFASCLTAQCPAYFSWQPDPYAVATFLQDWSQIKGYANPPWSLIGWVLSIVHVDKTHMVLVTPIWKYTAMVTPTTADSSCNTTSDQSPSDNAEQRSREFRPSNSRVAYLRERYCHEELSEEATLHSCSSHVELQRTILQLNL